MALHGFSDSSACLAGLAAHWLPHFSVVLPDARGHGHSARYRPELPAGFELDDVIDVLDALQLSSVILYGHSMGAGTAARLTARDPQRVQALILEDPPWRAEATPDQRPPARRGRSWYEILRRRGAADLEALSQRMHASWPADEHAPWAASKSQLDAHADALLRALHDDEGPRIAARLRCPGLLLTAEVDRDAIVTDATAAQVLQSWPQCHHVRIAGAGHNIRRDARPALTAAVDAFLATLASGRHDPTRAASAAGNPRRGQQRRCGQRRRDRPRAPVQYLCA